MIPRLMADTLKRLTTSFPILGVTGPRQSGKTTLVKKLFSDKPYVTLEDPNERQFAQEDPKGFLKRFEAGAIFDEAQRWPELFSYLQGMVDEDRQPGRFILTGSQQFNLLAGITQSLAGRIGMTRLLPLQRAELKSASALKMDLDNINTQILRGAYPAIYSTHQPLANSDTNQNQYRQDWFASYVTTYIERDVRQLVGVQDLATFQRFIKLCAARTGQLLNLTSLAGEAGVSPTTAKSWLSILETSDLIYILSPYYQNFGKRLVKAPKLYFIDTGLAAWFLGVRDEETLAIHPLRGALFETYIVTEHLKQRYNKGMPADLYFWRDSNGYESDLVYEVTTQVDGKSTLKLQTIEIKSGATITSDFVKAGKRTGKFAGDFAITPQLIYGGDESYQRSGIHFLSWKDLFTH